MRNAKKKGISPVIATVILVAIAIVISIAAAFWMTGLLSSFTSYEKIEIRYIYATRYDNNKYNVTLTVANTGSAVATIQELRINDKMLSYYSPIPMTNLTLPYTLEPGKIVNFHIDNIDISLFRPGTSIKISVVTSVTSYDKTVTLP
jgi:flagellin-like protein